MMSDENKASNWKHLRLLTVTKVNHLQSEIIPVTLQIVGTFNQSQKNILLINQQADN